MTLWIAAALLGVLILGPCVGVWWLLVREPKDRREVVSEGWRDDQIRRE